MAKMLFVLLHGLSDFGDMTQALYPFLKHKWNLKIETRLYIIPIWWIMGHLIYILEPS